MEDSSYVRSDTEGSEATNSLTFLTDENICQAPRTIATTDHCNTYSRALQYGRRDFVMISLSYTRTSIQSLFLRSVS